jgi:hypothetical protein
VSQCFTVNAPTTIATTAMRQNAPKMLTALLARGAWRGENRSLCLFFIFISLIVNLLSKTFA